MSARVRRIRSEGTRWVCVVTLAALVGCGRPAPPPRVDTGAREAVRAYFEGVIRKDWKALYPALHPDSRKRYTREQFALQATAYRKRLRFEPEVVIIRSCQEHGAEAIGRVILTTRATRHKPRFNDAVVVRRDAGVWRVVLPDYFGR